MKKYINPLRIVLTVFIFQLLLLSCSKEEKEPGEQDPIGWVGQGDNKFEGMYIARDPRLNPSIPEHRYILGEAGEGQPQFSHSAFSRLKSSSIFTGNNMKLIVDGAKGGAMIKSTFLTPGHTITGLSSNQHARLLYVETGGKKVFFSYYNQDQSHRALGADHGARLDIEPWRRRENQWIIHDFSDNNDFKWVAIESAYERGWFIMNAATLNGDTRIRLIKQTSVGNATKWEIHKP